MDTQLKLQSTPIKRNSKCPCGSGKKLKQCCIDKVKEMQTAVEAGVDPRTILVNRILEGRHEQPSNHH